MKQTLFSQVRRNTLRLASAASASYLLSACSQNPKAPPLLPHDSWQRIGVLPVREQLTTGDGVAFVKANTRVGARLVFIPLSPGAIVMSAIGTAASAISQSQRVSFADQVASIGFDAQAYFNQNLLPQFEVRGVKVEALTNTEVEAAIRSDNIAAVPKNLDAVLDIRITSSGYYPSSRAGGYSPMLYVVARLIPSSGRWEHVERFGYDSDYRAAEGELRFYTTPPGISVADSSELSQKAAEVRTAMENVSSKMLSQIVTDTDRRMKNLPRLQ